LCEEEILFKLSLSTFIYRTKRELKSTTREIKEISRSNGKQISVADELRRLKKPREE
jgi:hypothetical protein